MVLYDDKKWLCRLIRTGFSIDDDTGICEKVLRQTPYLEGYDPDSESGESDESFDIRGTVQFQSVNKTRGPFTLWFLEGTEMRHRHRSNTAMRLEKLDKQHRAKNETQVVRLNPDEPIKNEIVFKKDTDFYARREKRNADSTDIFSTKSLIESIASSDNLPFRKYARFEASCQPESIPSKTMLIFLTFLDPAQRSYPLKVSVTVTARISDLIGLILWMSSQTYPAAELFPPHHYKLQIADEDGEWDADFPPLDQNEPVIKFSFSHLALVKCDGAQRADSQHRITVSFLLPNRSTFRLKVENPDILIGELVQVVLSESGWNLKSLPGQSTLTLGYHLEKLGDPRTKFSDPLQPLSLVGKCKDFCLVRDGSKSVQDVASTSHNYGDTRSRGAGAVTLSDGRPDLMFTCMIPVTVAVGRFNKLKNAMCVIWGGDRMDLEFQHKVKSYPLNLINGVKYDGTKNRIVLSILQPSSSDFVGSHYLTTTTQLTFLTSEPHLASELYHHFNLVLTNRK